MDFDNSAQVDALAKLPADPVKPAAKWSGWTAPLRALPAAAAEAMAGAGEVAVTGARSVAALRDAPRWKGQTLAEREAADRQAQAGVTGQNEFSRSLRDVAEHYSPDPATASTAENVVFQLTRGLGKALGYGLTMGPVGIGLFAADEGLTEADRLQRQGVDAATATQAGVVTGLATGAGAFVPVAPLAKGFTAANVAKVGALGAVSGPMTFAAQQQMTRDILGQANYGEIAKRYDPLDPLGLTVSAVAPWAFGAVSLRGGVKAGRPQKATEPAETGPPVADQAPAAPTPPEAVDAAMVHNLTLIRSAHEARTPDVQAVRPIETLQQFVDRTQFKAEPDPKAPQSSFLRWVRDNGGLDMAHKVDITGEPSGVRSNPGGIFRRGGASPDDLATRAADEGYLPVDVGQDSGAFVDLVKRAVMGEQILTMQQAGERAAVVAKQTEQAYRLDQLERRLQVLGVDPEAAKGNAKVIEAYLREHEDSLLSTALADAAEPKPEPRARSDAVERARTALQDMRDSGDTPDVFLAKANLPPETRNLVLGLAEAGADTKRADGMLADFERTTAARPDAAPVDVAADVVEAARAGNFVTPEPAVAPKPTDPLARSIADRVQAIEETMPDLKVDDGTTAAEYMAKARREAAEGTADELGLIDSDLVRVAAECALMVGA